jgi:hypothetical protein
MRRLLVLLCAAASLGIAIPAHAEPNVDASFVDALNKADITFSNSKSAVKAGKAACDLMDQGKAEIDVVQLVVQQNSGISTVSAAKFTAIAASAYCPQHLHRATDNGDSPSPSPGDGMGVSGGQQ